MEESKININSGTINGISIKKPDKPHITFKVGDSEVLKLKEDGMYYMGKLLEIDKEVESAFREFLETVGILK